MATFSTPRADFATIYFATKPDRATDGSFLTENVELVDVLTDSEIQTGRWLSEDRLNPGMYWVLLQASPDFESCYLVDSGTYDPACANGYSDVLTLSIDKPTVRYSVSATVYRYLREASLRLAATPLGETRSYRLCYPIRRHKVRCLSGTLDGFSWDYGASDTLTVSTRNLAPKTRFTWYVAGKKVASRQIKVR